MPFHQRELAFLPLLCGPFPSQMVQERLSLNRLDCSLSLLLLTQLSGPLFQAAVLTQAEQSQVCSQWQFSLSLANLMLPLRRESHMEA